MKIKYMSILKGNEDTAKTNRIMRTIALHDCWKRQYNNSILQAMEKNIGMKIPDYPQHDLMKIAFSGIKHMCARGTKGE